MSTAGRIREKLTNIPEGVPFTSSAFLTMGPRASVDQAFSRMLRKGVLSRVARGVYMKPQRNRFVGEVPPEPYHVAQAIARSSGTVVDWHGAEAARRLGLSTQVPAMPVFLTSGSSRTIRIGNSVMELRRTASRKLHFAGRPAGQALSALWYLGRRRVTPEVIHTIKLTLPPEEYEALLGARHVMPGWMAEAFLSVEGVGRG